MPGDIVESDKEMELIVDKLESVKESGFGEVRILVRNGAVYRILTTEDALIEEKEK